MTDKRFDNRTKQQFQKDILHCTKVESFWMKTFAEECKINENFHLEKYVDNGVANDGSYVQSGKSTYGADYKVWLLDKNRSNNVEQFPLEVKFAPTAGKITLKNRDIEGYIKEKASILFIVNTKQPTLKKPKNHNLNEHISFIKKHMSNIRFGIMYPETIATLNQKFKTIKIPYMGGKSGIIIESKYFDQLFKLYDFSVTKN